MKSSNYIIYLLPLFLVACSQDQIQSAAGNPKHTCEYKTTVLATARNLTSKDLSMRFCSAYGDLKSVDHVVPADQSGHTYDVWTYKHQESFYDSAAETCADKGMRDQSIVYSFASLSELELNNFNICENFNGSASNPVPAYHEKFVVIEKSEVCPSGFTSYDQSQHRCQ